MAHTKNNSLVLALCAALLLGDSLVWFQIASGHDTNVARDYFLDVGQGDSELMILPGNVNVMTDAGPTDEVVSKIEKILPAGDAYIDLAIISDPQLDDFNGYYFVLDHYRIGAFIYSGRDASPGNEAWWNLKAKIKQKGIPLITLGRGDSIQYGDNEIEFLSPNLDFAQSADLNDAGLVELVTTPSFKTLLTSDIGFNVEDWLRAHNPDIHAAVLKISHQGSKYASGETFLRAVNPKIAVIEVGAHNLYGYPSSSTLARISSLSNALVFRTDQDGTIEVYTDDGKLKIDKEKEP
jgi:beta-lactamase superfamily II metal-dependent hydrolase